MAWVGPAVIMINERLCVGEIDLVYEMTDVEIVKKGYLYYHRNHSHSTTKPSWFVFRIGSSTSGRILDIYNTEKESTKKNSIPKERIYLREIQSVVGAGHDNLKQFFLMDITGCVQNCLEAQSDTECNEWVFALNAVLFGKGFNGRNLIQFGVHINKCAQFGYYGYGILEVRDDTLIVWSQGEKEEVVRWKLGHLRSFKAKVGVLEIIAGSRSSTGEGVFMFGTQESVLITHTLETVIDRLARIKRTRNIKSQQALPPLPSLNMPLPSSMPPGSLSPSIFHGYTDTKNLVPSFSDIPIDTSVQVPQHYDHTVSTCMRQHKTSLPAESFMKYDKLQSSDYPRSVSASTLPSPKRDIYTLDFVDKNTRQSSHLSMVKGFDYSYVETEPKCILVSPTDNDNLGIGEIRHFKSDSKVSPKSSGATADCFEVDDGNYSSLNPVNETDKILPGGLYNQLEFTLEKDEIITEDSESPPPLPPPMIPSPVVSKKGYENIGNHSSHRIGAYEKNQNDLSDSVGSLELNLEGSNSPKIMMKTKSPKATPQQSPREQYKTTFNTSSSAYDKVTRTESTTPKNIHSFELSGYEQSRGYSKLTPKHEAQITAVNTGMLSDCEDSSPYSQLSRKIKSQSLPRQTHGDYDQVTIPHQKSTFDEEGYSKFSHSITKPLLDSENSEHGAAYSTLQKHPPDSPMITAVDNMKLSSYEEIDSLSRVDDSLSSKYEQIENLHSTCNPYDEVEFTETNSSVNTVDSSLIDDNNTEQNLNIPPVPPRRDASMKDKKSRKPPPLKPKPNSVAKT